MSASMRGIIVAAAFAAGGAVGVVSTVASQSQTERAAELVDGGTIVPYGCHESQLGVIACPMPAGARLK